MARHLRALPPVDLPDRLAADLELELANNKALATASSAAEAAASERAGDLAQNTKQQGELTHASKACATEHDCRIRRGCVILR
ncbi:hypothetical protein [Sphingomonas crocodyli]|uniref:Uncharacterized protein n=1 Tax=Sphingomonas crocodyli TaxID=1979270 RepID=A0A437M530_9SPHN|nr:hypothetical protein [Sphingomonas crocodyli]RVT92830.1 hypothetical protein EOD43_02630 [Sphingomonas crocodyli]